MKHTKGVWQVAINNIGKVYAFTIISHAGSAICDIYRKRGMHTKEAEANANLISAAPDMLQALIFCKSVIQATGMYERSEQLAYEAADAAIKMASGKAILTKEPTT